MKKVAILVSTALLIGTLLAACGGEAPAPSGSAGRTAEAKPPEPVTLKVLWTGREDSFNDRVNNPIVKAKLPHVSFEFYSLNQGLENLLMSGVKFDLMNITTKVFFEAVRLKLTSDMTGLLQTHQFDMGRFLPEHVEAIRLLTGDGKLYAVPDKANFPYAYHALVFNKDIFDKFAVPYPKDNMTWDEVVELAKRVQRVDGGTAYTGLGLGTSQYMYEQSALHYQNKQRKVDLSNPLFGKIFHIYQKAYNVIGKDPLGNVDAFMKDKNVAMFAGHVGVLIEEATRQKDTLPNWDIVTFPVFEETPNSAPPINGVYMVASTSEHKDETIRLIDAILSKDNTKAIEDGYMNPEFAKKNINAVKAPKQSLYVPGAFDTQGNALFNKKIRELNKNGGDINTSQREMQEELQKVVDGSP
ncbi:ABC transporter substrate-binding protein [Paenibacillus hodogayensis]|uniref:ABC transporter substrate-binding protein n=1 Tax=Paenibacillus hodogayensis TaxID=279208 RepID=A0ABV5W4I5_9BACL